MPCSFEACLNQGIGVLNFFFLMKIIIYHHVNLEVIRRGMAHKRLRTTAVQCCVLYPCCVGVFGMFAIM